MDPIVALISSDISEKHVLAEAFRAGSRLTFCFSYNADRPTCLGSRVVAGYNDHDDQCQPFSDRQSLRDAISAAISNVWATCIVHPSARMLDVIVHLDDDSKKDHRPPLWTVSHDSRYQFYFESLRRAQSLGNASVPAPRLVTWSELEFSYVLGGRSSTTLAILDGKQYVYKGLTFRLFLELEKNFKHEMAAFYNEIDVVSRLPEHSSLLSKPTIFVTVEPVTNISSEYQDTRYCGTLYPYFPTGDLQERIDAAGVSERLELFKKAKWASQITSALQATHLAGEYHMDFKPANVLLDPDENAILIDWEQYGASRFFVAPEADGTWDVDDAAGTLKYHRHVGSAPEDAPTWPPRNVFPLWQKKYPRALELAEVYSLGRTLWVLLEQIPSDDFDDIRAVSWSTNADDIPSVWKELVARCCDVDPLQRCSLADACKFWESQ